MRNRGAPAARRHRAPAPEEGSLTATVRLVGSFPRADTPLAPQHPEVAFVGRSNVGKSSLLNALVGARPARVSAQPGKTRLMNVYLWEVGDRSLYLLDLPGYGWARASKTQRAAFRRLVARVLERPRLAGVVWLLDIRHPPSREDGAMHEALAAAGVPVLAALTKGDKLPRGQRLRRRAALQETLELTDDQMIVTSARTGDGLAELREAVGRLAPGNAE